MHTGPTEMQAKAVENVLQQKIAGRNINKKKALLDAGYSLHTANQGTRVFQSKGIREALEKYDLTEESFSGYLSNDLKVLDARDRLGHLKLLADVLNLRETNLNVYNQKSDEAMNLLAQLMAKGKADVEDATDEPL